MTDRISTAELDQALAASAAREIEPPSTTRRRTMELREAIDIISGRKDASNTDIILASTVINYSVADGTLIPADNTTSVAEAATFDPATENMIGWLLDRNADKIVLVDDFPDRCGLDMSLNDPCTGDLLEVATLETEDSGYSPALWKLALEVLKQRRRALAAQTGEPQ